MSASSTKEAKIGFADLYEQFIVPTMSAQWAPRVVEAASILTGERVLDVGCGTGVLTREVADRVGSDGRVSGLDVNADMLEVARRIRPDIDWHQGDAGNLPHSGRRGLDPYERSHCDSKEELISSRFGFIYAS